jgi:hypothetical protein
MEDMERGERGGVVLDGGEGTEEKGAIDAAIDQTNKEANEIVDESGGATDLNAGTEVSEDGKDAGETEGEVVEGSESPGTKVNPELAAFKEEIKAELAKLAPVAPAAEVKPLTEEQWGKLEEDWGQPRQTIQRITNQNVQVVRKLTEYIDSRFAKLEVGDTIQAVSKEALYTDAPRYQKEIREFIQDYDPKHWSNPELIKRAVIYARGLNANANLQKVRTDTEKNKKIAGPARPSSPSGGIKRTTMPALNGAHREAANLMGSEGEYNKFRTRPSRQIE